MSKIKSFFGKLFSPVAKLFHFLVATIKKFFVKLGETKVVKKIVYILMYIPNKISSRLKNSTRKAIWGVIFVVPFVIGFVYFFLLPFIYTIIYSLSWVENTGGLEFLGFDNYIFAFKEATARNQNYVSMSFAERIVDSLIGLITDIPIILISTDRRTKSEQWL